jgi:membrane protein YdbS with pleckstrin-like domain
MSKSIVLKPNWKRWFWGYFSGVLLVPVLGIGIAVLWIVHTRRKQVIYEVTDRQIEHRNRKISQKIDLANVKTLDVKQNWLDKKFGIGDLTLSTETRSITLKGQSNPEKLSNMISAAVRAERKRIDELSHVKNIPEDEPPPPGTLDKLDYLTGLWQQGLLSDEDFKKEKKHFES